jgi:hypothetical protein
MEGPKSADTSRQSLDSVHPAIGQIVQVRSRTYLVDQVIRSEGAAASSDDSGSHMPCESLGTGWRHMCFLIRIYGRV